MLDFEAPQVIIAEVTTAWNLGDFVAKAKELHDHGRQRIRKELMDRAKSTIPNIAEWSIEIQLFVREDRKADLENRIGKLQFQAEVITLELSVGRNPPNKNGSRCESRLHLPEFF